MLAKGPVAVVLPIAATMLFLLVRRDLRRLGDVRLLGASLMFFMIAAPWYIWVGVETKGEWLTGFFLKHNIERAVGVLENHSGPFYYYGLVLIVGLMPWSVFLWPALRYPLTVLRQKENTNGELTFLLCWIVVWFVFFTVVRTKLPNYILPAYPAVALLTAWFLESWRNGRITLPSWMMPVSLTWLALAGVGISVGLLLAGDVLPLHERRLPGLEKGAWLGSLFLFAATAAWCFRRSRGGLIGCVASSAIVFNGALAFWGVNLVDRFKAPRPLIQALPEDQLRREIRVGAIGFFQPSLVFYCQREVKRPENLVFAIELLHTPQPVYVFVSAEAWEQVRMFAPPSFHLLARHHDLYTGREVLLMTNEPLN